MKYHRSQELFEQARQVIPGGVNSPVRACKAVGQTPLFIDRAVGCFVFDADGNRYIDYVGSWGPMILGHRPAVVIDAIKQVLERGISFGAPTDLEVELADMIIEAVPSVEMVRMVNSGTEATMSAIRLARGFTGKNGVVKFDGCYHGHVDSLLVAAGSGVATLNIPGSPGVPEDVVRHTLSVPYNDVEGFVRLMDRHGDRMACVIVEPVAGNMGLVKPADGFLQALREETRRHDCLLIFDEVMTGFRVAYGGAQARYGILPDLTTLGKVIGGGMPVGAYGGRCDIMTHIAPEGPVYQAGTLSGNPVAMAAGIATLKQIRHEGFYDALEERAARLHAGLEDAIGKTGVAAQVDRVGSMVGLFFTAAPVRNFADAKTCDLNRFSAFYRAMRRRGIYLAPSQFEALFVSSAHNIAHIDETLAAAADSLQEIARA